MKLIPSKTYYFTATLEVSAAFGMNIKARGFENFTSYKYSFSGKENDKEISGSGNNLDFGARIYDSRLGKFLSVDPLFRQYVPLTPYHFTLNNPICFKDNNGKVVIDANGNPVTLSKDDKGNISFNSDIAPATKELLNYYLKSNVGKTQLEKMDVTVTKITIEESQQAAFQHDKETNTYELLLGVTESTGKAKEKDGTTTYKESKITLYVGSVDLQSASITI